MQEYVCGFAFTLTNFKTAYERLVSVLLILKSRPDWQKGRYNGIGGHIETNETPAQAMIREFHEEVLPFEEPSVAAAIEWHPFAVLTGVGQEPPWRVHFFRAMTDPRFWEGKTIGNPQDNEPVQWFPSHALPQSALFNLRWLIPLALDNHIGNPVYLTDVSAANTGNREKT